MKKKYTTYSVFSTLIALTLVFGCDGGGTINDDPFSTSEYDSYGPGLGERVEAYHNAILGNVVDKDSGNVALYIDFSAGMHTAFTNADIKMLTADCFGAV